jgi:hypothetical protein
MKKTAVKIFPWIVLAIPFVGLAYFYNSIGGEILIYRSVGGSYAVFAPKSLFTVFRVPLIEVVCAAVVETLRPRFAGSESGFGAFSAWNILLYAIAFKSLFQFLEFISTSVYNAPDYAENFFYATFAVVIAGILLTLFKWRGIFADFKRREWKLSGAKKIALGFMLLAYLMLAIAPMFS